MKQKNIKKYSKVDDKTYQKLVDKNRTIINSKRPKEDRDSLQKRLMIVILLVIFFIAFIFLIREVFFKPTKPIISETKSKWYTEKIVSVKKDSYSKNKIKYYLVCVNKKNNLNTCNWKKTYTKNIEISKNGKYYVYFKGVDTKNQISNPSNVAIVYIDNTAPSINEIKKVVTKNQIKLTINAKDEESGIKNYYYKLDNGEYIKLDGNILDLKKLTPDTKYHITIKVEDKAGNIKEVELDITTKKDNSLSSETNSNENNNSNNESSETTKDNNTNNNESSNEEVKEEEVKEIPLLSLSGVPKTFKYGESYVLPTSVKFGKSGGEVSCKIEDKKYTETSTIPIGEHTIICTATSKTGVSVTEKKDIKVELDSSEESIFDGWIKMNLYFPEDSTDWKWRLGKEDETRTGNDNTSWQDYTGPITVRLSDVENVYIKYKLKNGEEVVVSPSGKIVVDIRPNSYSISKATTTKVKIIYSNDADKKQYKINDGSWQDYKGEFVANPDTTIQARVIKTTSIYDKDGNVKQTSTQSNYDSVYISEKTDKTPTTIAPSINNTYAIVSGNSINGGFSWIQGSNYLSQSLLTYYLKGPSITVSPSDLTTSTTVTITPQKEARKVYYKIDDGVWNEYEEPFTISKNTWIYAKYIEKETGTTSETTTYHLNNISVPTKPYVRIDSNKSLYDLTTSMNITISGNNYDSLKYSYDGEIYYDYNTPLVITNNCTIYAKGTNNNGETIEKLNITNIGNNPPEKEKLDINISTNPDAKDVKGLINSVEVSINYDKNATKKYYKLGNGDYQEYKGTFEVTSNCVITAYATSDTAEGKISKRIDFLTTGISSPIINLDTTSHSTKVKVTIDYDKNASIKKYRIGNGDLEEYTGSFEVSDNEIIYAYNEDILGNNASSTYMITNIIKEPKYIIIDKGMYFILKLNYPITSKVETREYKWTPTGTWKKYDTKGILLIKKEYEKELISNDSDIKIKVEDNSGNEVVFTDNYYVVNMTSDELMENLFMRWDNKIPTAPTFTLSETNPTRSLDVTINYDEASILKEYKIVNKDNQESDWMTYSDPITVTDNNTIIYARSKNESEVMSPTSSTKITNIDEIFPIIGVNADFETPTRKLTIQLVGEDNLKVNCVAYAKGEHNAKYMEEQGEFIENNGTFTVSENGKYTIFVQDAVGNEVVEIIDITNIDLNAPDIDINVLTKSYGTTAEIEIDYGDSKTTQYKIGENGTYKTYSSKLTINSNDVLNLVNDDGSLTIYVKGTDTAGNTNEVFEKIYVLDLDAPEKPVINASSGYPILTEYGVKYDDAASIAYDTRDDITNYYSIDNGETWKVYTGPFQISSGTIMAKSVKKVSGLTIENNKIVAIPNNAVGANAYDKNLNTIFSKSGKYYLYVDPSMNNKKLNLSFGLSFYSSMVISYLDESNTVLQKYTYSNNRDGSYNINQLVPIGTNKIEFTMNLFNNEGRNYYPYITEIKIANEPVISNTQVLPKMTSTGIKNSYNLVAIKYFNTNVTKLYKIDDGEWINYENKEIKVNVGQTIYAKGINSDGEETRIVSSYKSAVANELGEKAYDGNTTTSFSSSGNYYIDVDKAMYEQTININFGLRFYSSMTINYLDKDNDILKSYVYSNRNNGTFNINQIIPTGTTKIEFAMRLFNNEGSNYYPYINEISLINNNSSYSLDEQETSQQPEDKTDEIPVFEKEPEFIISDSGKWTEYKTVNINYSNNAYTNEYSYDAKTWMPYTSELHITENCTIYTRSMNDGKLITSSSYKINYVDDTEPSISLDDIPSTITVGDDYIIPSKYSYNEDKSKATYACTIDNKEVTSTKDLQPGIYSIICNITTGANKSNSTVKEITVLEKVQEEQTPIEEQQETIPPEETITKENINVIEGETNEEQITE